MTRPRLTNVKPVKVSQVEFHKFPHPRTVKTTGLAIPAWSCEQTKLANSMLANAKQVELVPTEALGTNWKISRRALFPKTNWALPTLANIIWPLPQPQMSSKDTLHNPSPDPKALPTVARFNTCKCWEMIGAEPECCWGLHLWWRVVEASFLSAAYAGGRPSCSG